MHKFVLLLVVLIVLPCSHHAAMASRTVVYEYECEVVDIEDRDELLGDKVQIGDQFTTTFQSLLSVSLSLQNPQPGQDEFMFSGMHILDFHIENDQLQYYGFGGWLGIVTTYEVEELSRSGGNCLNSLELAWDFGGGGIDGDLITNADFRFKFSSEECYGELMFEHPDPLLMPEWEATDIIIHNDYANGLEEYKIHLKVNRTQILDIKGGEVRVIPFADLNENCSRESFEPILPEVTVMAKQPGTRYIQVGNRFNAETGYAVLVLPENTGHIYPSEQEPMLLAECLGGPIPFEFNANGDPIFIDLPLIPVDDDENTRPVSLGADAARIGRKMDYRIFVKNTTSAPISGRVVLTFDPLLRAETTQPSAQSRNNAAIIWELAELAPGERRIYHAKMSVPKNLSLQGDDLCARATVVGADGADLFADRFCQKIVGLYPPIRLARVKQDLGADASIVAAGDELEYVAFFQNAGSQPAENVWIDIPADQDFDAHSLRIDAASHNYRLETPADGGHRILFNNIHLAGSENDPDASTGFVRFRVVLNPELNDGEFVESSVMVHYEYANHADEQPEVLALTSNILVSQITNTVSSVRYDSENNSIMLYPNPGSDFMTIRWENAPQATLTLRNTIGATVYTQSVQGSSSILDLRAFTTGMYFLTVVTESGITVKPLQVMR